MQIELINNTSFYPIPYCDKYVVEGTQHIELNSDTLYYRYIYGDIYDLTLPSLRKITSNGKVSLLVPSNKLMNFKIPNNNYKIYEGNTYEIYDIDKYPVYTENAYIGTIQIKMYSECCDIIILKSIDFSSYVFYSNIVYIQPLEYINTDNFYIKGDEKNIINYLNTYTNINDVNNNTKYRYINNASKREFGLEVISGVTSTWADNAFRFNNLVISDTYYVHFLLDSKLDSEEFYNRISFPTFASNHIKLDKGLTTKYMTFNGVATSTSASLAVYISSNQSVGSYVRINDTVVTNYKDYNYRYRELPKPVPDKLLERTFVKIVGVTIKFYNNKSENHRVDKSNYLDELFILNGVFRDEISIISPSFRIVTNNLPTANYCYIDEFKRYYYIDDITLYRNGVWDISCSCDTLMSFKTDIYNLNGIVGRQETEYNELLNDTILPISLNYEYDQYNGRESELDYNLYNRVYNSSEDKYDYVYNCSISMCGNPPMFESAGQDHDPLGNLYPFVGQSVGSYTYVANLDTINSIIRKLYTFEFSDLFTQLFQNDSDYIFSTYWFPFDIVKLSRVRHNISISYREENSVLITPNRVTGNNYEIGTIYVGGNAYSSLDIGYDQNRTIYVVSKFNIIVLGGYVEVIPKYNSFIDYSNLTEIELFIPFCGWVKLDANVVMNHTIYLKYVTNLKSGMATAVLTLDNYDGIVVMYQELQLGVEMPVGHSNESSIARGLFSSTMGLAASVVTKGASVAASMGNLSNLKQRATPKTTSKTKLGAKISSAQSQVNQDVVGLGSSMATNTASVITSMGSSYSLGNVGKNTSSIDISNNMILRIKRPTVINVDNYNHNFGKPLMQNRTISDLIGKGFTKFDAIHIDNVGVATQAEKDDIHSNLISGVLL